MLGISFWFVLSLRYFWTFICLVPSSVDPLFSPQLSGVVYVGVLPIVTQYHLFSYFFLPLIPSYPHHYQPGCSDTGSCVGCDYIVPLVIQTFLLLVLEVFPLFVCCPYLLFQTFTKKDFWVFDSWEEVFTSCYISVTWYHTCPFVLSVTCIVLLQIYCLLSDPGPVPCVEAYHIYCLEYYY